IVKRSNLSLTSFLTKGEDFGKVMNRTSRVSWIRTPGSSTEADVVHVDSTDVLETEGCFD
ncbi:MAG: hypothetical protein QW579_06280, partial [Desulfurococcaceae archaeon]